MLMLVICGLLALVVPAQALLRSEADDAVTVARADPETAFRVWADRNGKEYDTLHEHNRRFSIWMDNLNYVESYNSEHTRSWLGLGPFMDLTDEEFSSQMHGGGP
eukprot:jgi/Ulvmu1/816/UM010_0190.1